MTAKFSTSQTALASSAIATVLFCQLLGAVIGIRSDLLAFGEEHEEAQGIQVGEGWLCLDENDASRWRTRTDVQEFMDGHDLGAEFKTLAPALRRALRKRAKKRGPALALAVLENGEDAFHSKGMDVMLTKEENLFRTRYGVCFVESGASLSEELRESVYRDGAEVQINCLRRMGQMPLGAGAWQAYRGRDEVRRLQRKDSLPADALRILTQRGALDLYAEYSKTIRGRPKILKPVSKNQWDILAVEAYKARFAELGVGLFLNVNPSSCSTSKYWWLEVADLTVLGSDYKPEHAYELDAKLLKWVMCKAPKRARDLAEEGKFASKIPSSQCHQAVGAKRYFHSPYAECGCSGWRTKLFCGSKNTGLHKWDKGMLSEECVAGAMYCSRKRCNALP